MQRAVELLQDSRWLATLGIILSIGCVFMAAFFGLEVNLIVLAVLFAGMSYWLIDRQPVYGMVILLTSTFILPFAIKVFRVYGLPVTTFIEAINVVFFVSLMLKRKLRGVNTFIGILVMTWFFIQFAELANPNANSRIAGVFAFRVMVMLTLAFFASYSAIRTKSDLYIFIHGWIAMALIGALYGFYQEFAGLPSWDYQWATITEWRYKLLFTWGRLRKFGFFTSPGEFGQVMVYGGMTCFVLAFMTRMSLIRRAVLFVFAILMFVSMMFSGSRTAMILLTAGIGMFAAMTLKRTVLIGVALVVMFGGVLIFKSYSSKTLHVMSTAFEGKEDNSMEVRLINQQIIRQYIKGAPFGFGLGSIGYYGSKYSGGTFIGSFPPDSEYVKVAVETGWLGLILWLTIQFLMFCWGVNSYFSIKDKELKDLMTIPMVLFFMMIVAQYPQEFFRAPVLSILYATCLAMIAKIKSLDQSTTPITAEDRD
jgi:hypothetical protein